MGRYVAMILGLACLGCGPKGEVAVEPPVEDTTSLKALSVDGPGGEVAIGGTLEEAKNAFPPPEGAEVFENTSFFDELGLQGWRWGYGEGTGFEVGTKDGKVVALALTELDGPAPDGAIEEHKRLYGEPTKMADGKTAAMMVWQSGEYARFFLLFKGGHPLYGAGAITIIGSKAHLQTRGYQPDHPEVFVEETDGSAQQLEEQEKKKG